MFFLFNLGISLGDRLLGEPNRESAGRKEEKKKRGICKRGRNTVIRQVHGHDWVSVLNTRWYETTCACSKSISKPPLQGLGGEGGQVGWLVGQEQGEVMRDIAERREQQQQKGSRKIDCCCQLEPHGRHRFRSIGCLHVKQARSLACCWSDTVHAFSINSYCIPGRGVGGEEKVLAKLLCRGRAHLGTRTPTQFGSRFSKVQFKTRVQKFPRMGAGNRRKWQGAEAR